MDLRRVEKMEEANWRQTQVVADLTLDNQPQKDEILNLVAV